MAREEQKGLLNTVCEDETYRALMEELSVTSVIGVPLKSQKTNLGVLLLARTDNYFAPSDSEFLSVLCGQASVAWKTPGFSLKFRMPTNNCKSWTT